ncbi:MAG: hypothetical protein E6Q40_04515 [Cupriavidus sp.]|nr:MAG: hypothetical protein E6Q40_04515 [Cupriavidus sp.]
MTPLAHRIVKERTLPIRERSFNDQSGLLQRMDDIHCFEATEIFPLALQLAADLITREEWLPDTAFLPAPRTWIEFRSNGERTGVLLEDIAGKLADVRLAGRNGSLSIPLTLWLGEAAITNPDARISGNVEDHFQRVLVAILAIINSPRIIGRQQHAPHKGLERRLLKEKGLVGKFPLHAWTELKLSVTDIGTQANGTVHEAHYTGEKCLHFCRAHIRVKRGRLEKVSGHWRGNPALGIKRTRYRLVA